MGIVKRFCDKIAAGSGHGRVYSCSGGSCVWGSVGGLNAICISAAFAHGMSRVPSALCISAAPRMGCRACRAPFVYRQRRGWDVTRAECPLYICSSTRVRCRACRMLSASMRLPAWDAALYHGHRFDAADVGKRAAAEGNKADT